MPRLPTQADFHQSLAVSITKNPGQQPPTNVLILLHGLGDSETPFSKLGAQLNLPHTCALAVRGLKPLPFDLPGSHWGDDINISQGTGALDPDAGFDQSTRVLLDEVIRGALVGKCGFKTRDVVLWGFGQGGMLALSLAKATEEVKDKDGISELGGVISVGGPLPETIAARSKADGKFRTPVIALGGVSGTLVTEEQVDRVKRVFEFVERVKWRRSGDGMPRDRSEMLPIMQFLARRLRATAPDGTVEVL